MTQVELLCWNRQLQAAEGYLELGLHSQAEAALQAIPADSPLEMGRRVLLGQAQARLGNWTAATESFSVAAGLMPPSAAMKLWLRAAECFKLVGAKEPARQALKKSDALQHTLLHQAVAKMLDQIVQNGPQSKPAAQPTQASAEKADHRWQDVRKQHASAKRPGLSVNRIQDNCLPKSE